VGGSKAKHLKNAATLSTKRGYDRQKTMSGSLEDSAKEL
jgi:hypothetical protein